MTAALSFDIVIGGICTVDMVHDLRQIPARSLQQEMIMIVHQAVSVNEGAIALVCRLQVREKLNPVQIAFEYCLSLIPSCGDVVKCTGIANTERPGH